MFRPQRSQSLQPILLISLVILLGATALLCKNLLFYSAIAAPQSANPHAVSLPYYKVKSGWDSLLILNNAVNEPLTVSLK